MEAFEYNGYWWLPGAETSRVAGVLKVSASGGMRQEFHVFHKARNGKYLGTKS